MTTLKINTTEDQKSRTLHSSNSTSGGIMPELHLGDNLDVRIELYDGSDLININLESDFSLAIGSSDVPSGEFILIYNGVESAPIPVESSIDQIETIVNAMSSVILDGGVAVTGSISLLQIEFRTAGTKQVFAIDDKDLTNGSASIASLDGDNITQVVYVDRGLIEYVTDFTNVEVDGDIVALDCNVNLNTISAAVAFGEQSEIKRIIQFNETLNDKRTTHLKTNVTLKADIVPASFAGVDYDTPTYWNYKDAIEALENLPALFATSSTLSVVSDVVTVDLETDEFQHELTVNNDVEIQIQGTSQVEKTIYIDFTGTSEITYPVGVNWLSVIPAAPVTYESGDKAMLLIRYAPTGEYYIGVIKVNDTE